MRQRTLVRTVVVGLLLAAVPATAFATAGDLYAAGTDYKASTYAHHRSVFGPCPDTWVADINANAGDKGRPVLAPEPGSVSIFSTGWGDGYGNSIIWASCDGREQIHVAHLSCFAATGPVTGGACIGYAGSTGNSTGDHMHVSRALDGQPAPLELSGQQIMPTVGSGTQYTSAGAVQGGVTFSVNVIDGMTYYEPVTLRPSVGGWVDIETVDFRLDGTRIYSGTVVSAPGTHTLVMRASSFGVPYSKTVTFTIAAPPAPWLRPVFRFYRPALGTHFYTNSHAERDTVITTLGKTYGYEGVAYWSDVDHDADPLYRFYRPSTGTHFYTSDEAEKNDVRSQLANVYTFEGVAYTVTATPQPGTTPVWRFYNRRNGTHFYTADEAERDAVVANLGATYTLDGPAFWLSQ